MRTSPAIVCAILLLSSATMHGAQGPTFSSKLEAVRVDVLVTDRGQVLPGLRREDFEVRDNGVLQTVDLVSFQQIPLNVILAFDVSASVSGERLGHLQDAGRTLLEHLTKDDRSALLTFSHAVALRQGLTGDIARVREALREVQPIGDTALVDGSYSAMMLDASDGGRSLLLVFSDGLDTASWLTPERVLDAARRSDIVVYGVATRGLEDSKFLEDLGDLTGGAVVKIESTKNLSATFLRILEEFRQRYLISYSPAGVSKDGWHRLDVRIKGRRATVKSRAGYQAGN
ncbi:MAG TPA: VWA domain-containing protein [Vicinamibacterales bacterium]|nr:VWA domain-containing protein [Vicinamibacterales bacterium]